MPRDNYRLLIEKLDEFIRKYYLNQLLRGSLYTVGLVLGLFILFNVLEYYFYFSTGVRTAMLWSFLITTAIACYKWIALPLLHYFRLGKIISHEQAAQIIGTHFSNVKDKLLNILQLKQQASNAIYTELIHAAIEQKSEEIKLVPFKAAIDLGKNRKYLRYALPPLFLLLFLLLSAPNILHEGTMRLWNSTKKFEKPAPFRFLVDTRALRAVQFTDFVLEVGVEGTALPHELFIEVGKVQYRLKKEAPNRFTYTFVNVQRDIVFRLYGGGVESEDYTLRVVRRPTMLAFRVKAQFPAYIGRASEELTNVGDLVVPQGTQLSWFFDAQYTDQISLRFGEEPVALADRQGDERFTFSRRAMRDEQYLIYLGNIDLPQADSVAYSITVLPDLHPQIDVEEFRDSSNTNLLFFAGAASDDYGLLKLTFNYQIKKAKIGQLPLVTIPLSKPNGKQIQYDYTWNLRDLDLQPGDEVVYYFEVFDNDGIKGSKSARTRLMQWRMPTLEEFRREQAQNNDEIRRELEAALRESARIQAEMKKLRQKVLQMRELDWKTRKDMEKLLERQRQLNQQIEQARKAFEENRKMQQDFNLQNNEELQRKEDQLQKLFDEALSEDLQKLMEDIERLLQEMGRDELLQETEEMQLKAEDLEKQLKRLEELFKQLEVENLLQQQIERLEQLAKEQEKLAEETEKGTKPDEQLAEEQKKLNEQMRQIAEQHEELLRKNEQLKRPEKIEDNRREMQDIEQDMKDASQQMEQNQKSKASKQQQKAANKMKNLANRMRQNRQQNEMEALEEDIAALRQLLKNLLALSFDQESIMQRFAGTPVNTPPFVELLQQQAKTRSDFRIVEDSLRALASRNFQIEGIILEKISEIKEGFRRSLDELEERRITQASEHQQRTMKALNDLALMLSEVLNNLQADANSGMPGTGACRKPAKEGSGKDGKKPMDKITKGQGELNQQMKELKQRLGQGQQGLSKEFAQLAAQQAALRRALRELQKEKQQQGKGSKALDEIMQEMDKVEIDLVNKRLTNETLLRQQQILTRLLEEERAEREQEQDDKREAETARQQHTPKLPPALEEYLKKRRAEVDLFRTVSPALKPYYKQLVEEYIKSTGK
ncbi:MAG: DUF4175 domain-containing protein [Saprospiraceae bacterium]|nr:DUF4175 domain-containing protein [Saprospiraceae bacterium]MDW8484596.1 DUF4175 family protein [Saprospiraceae bacterium]